MCRSFAIAGMLLLNAALAFGQAKAGESSRSLRDEVARIRAAQVKGKTAPADVPVLIEALKDKEVRVRIDAARALREIGPGAEAAVPALSEALKDESWYVRFPAAQALGKIGPSAKEAVPALIEALRCEDWNLTARSNIKESGQDVPSAAAQALGAIGSAAVPALIEALKDKDILVRIDAAEALEKTRGA